MDMQSAKIARNAVPKKDAEKIQKQVGQSLWNLRKASGISQEEMGKILSLHQSAVSRVETGFQNLTPTELFIVSRFFDVPVDEVLSGHIDYWRVGARFGQNVNLPRRYKTFAHSKVRDALPILVYYRNQLGELELEAMLSALKVRSGVATNPDMPIGSYFLIDLVEKLISERRLSRAGFKPIVDCARNQEAQGFLHPLYKTQKSAVSLVQQWVLNAHHYDSNLEYACEDVQADSVRVTARPAEHFSELELAPGVGEALCQYRRTFLAELPRYIGEDSMEVVEESCAFKGDACCSYRLSTPEKVK